MAFASVAGATIAIVTELAVLIGRIRERSSKVAILAVISVRVMDYSLGAIDRAGAFLLEGLSQLTRRLVQQVVRRLSLDARLRGSAQASFRGSRFREGESMMRVWLSAIVVVLGTVVLGAGSVAIYNHAILADETRTSGWNPALWLVILSGAGVVIVGTIQIMQSAFDRPAVGRTASAES